MIHWALSSHGNVELITGRDKSNHQLWWRTAETTELARTATMQLEQFHHL
jgi:hypothetical protein